MVLLPRFGVLGLEGPRDECCDEVITSAEKGVHPQLLFELGILGVLAQTLDNLLEVFEAEEPQVAVALLEHQVVSLPDLFGGGSEWQPVISKARLGEGSLCRIGRLAGLCSHELGDGGIPRSLHGEKKIRFQE